VAHVSSKASELLFISTEEFQNVILIGPQRNIFAKHSDFILSSLIEKIGATLLKVRESAKLAFLSCACNS